jgi:ferredoxin
MALRTYRQAGGTEALVLFHDAGVGAAAVAAAAAQLPENIIPLQVEECGSVGMDIWLAALAWGAAGVVLLATPQLTPAVGAEIEAQLSFAGAILGGMGYPPTALQCLGTSADTWVETLGSLPSGSPTVPAEFAPLDEKRSVIRLAVDHLFAQAPSPRPLVNLPAGAPFGEVWVDKVRCTLCMACVSQCPAGALLAGDETPQLKFIEANCVQCGLCCRSCPEDAIAASPRMLFDAELRRTARLLFGEEPFCCIRCGKPFATRSVITRITKQLQGHAMFQGDAITRIKMCEDCRVKALYDDSLAQENSQSPGGIS